MMIILGITVSALKDCEQTITPNDIPCRILSTWDYEDCDTTTARIYNSTPILISTRSFSNYASTGYCNFTWNITNKDTYFLNVSNGDTVMVIVESEADNMAGLSITIFILLITVAIFWLSTKKELLKNKYADFIIRRSFIVLGIFLMIFNSAIMATIADNAGLELTQEMFFFMKLFGYIGYPAMILLVFSTIVQSLKQWKLDSMNKRTGGDDE